MNRSIQPARRGRRFLLGAGLLMVALFAVAACDGDNLFSGENSTSRPKVDVIAPAVVLSGDSFQVRLDAQAPRGLARLDLSISGVLQRDTSYLVPGSASIVSPVFRFRVPDFFVGGIMVVMARALDKAGVASEVVTDTVTAILRTP